MADLCRVLGVSRSGCYQWRADKPPPPQWQPAAPGFVGRADRGSQDTRLAGRTRSEDAGALASYARPGSPCDNAQAAAGLSTLQTERLPHDGAFASLPAARLAAAYYLDTFFDLDRRPCALGYRAPHQVEAALLTPLP